MNQLFILLDGAATPNNTTQSFSFIWILLLFVLMWILMIRPQNKQKKAEEKMRNQLKKGDRVVFSGGIYGKVHSVGDTTVEVEVANDVILTVEKSFIQSTAEEVEKKETKK